MTMTSIAELATNLVWDRTNNNLKLGGAAASANATLAILGTKTIAVPASGSAWNALDFQASTLTLATGGVAPNELAAVRFKAPVITAGAASAYVVPVAATVIIDGPPTASAAGGATPTLTNAAALLVRDGSAVDVLSVYSAQVRINGNVSIKNKAHPEFLGWILEQDNSGHLVYSYPSWPVTICIVQKYTGECGIGITPTAKLHVGVASSGQAGTAPLKLAAGTLLVTEEAGAIESDGTHLYWTNAAGTRLQLDNAP
jgi:hypothetical protein